METAIALTLPVFIVLNVFFATRLTIALYTVGCALILKPVLLVIACMSIGVVIHFALSAARVYKVSPKGVSVGVLWLMAAGEVISGLNPTWHWANFDALVPHMYGAVALILITALSFVKK